MNTITLKQVEYIKNLIGKLDFGIYFQGEVEAQAKIQDFHIFSLFEGDVKAWESALINEDLASLKQLLPTSNQASQLIDELKIAASRRHFVMNVLRKPAKRNLQNKNSSVLDFVDRVTRLAKERGSKFQNFNEMLEAVQTDQSKEIENEWNS